LSLPPGSLDLILGTCLSRVGAQSPRGKLLQLPARLWNIAEPHGELHVFFPRLTDPCVARQTASLTQSRQLQPKHHQTASRRDGGASPNLHRRKNAPRMGRAQSSPVRTGQGPTDFIFEKMSSFLPWWKLRAPASQPERPASRRCFDGGEQITNGSAWALKAPQSGSPRP
jgi:hypothetical protein